MAGWRAGFLVGDAEIVGRVRTLVDHMFAGVPTAIQRGLLAALTGDQAHVAERRERYRARRDVLVAAIPGLRRPEGSFYAWWRLPQGLTAEEIVSRARVGVAPGIGFGSRGAGHVRLSLAVPDEDVAEGAARLAALLDQRQSSTDTVRWSRGPATDQNGFVAPPTTTTPTSPGS
jgi:aminotransferase